MEMRRPGVEGRGDEKDKLQLLFWLFCLGLEGRRYFRRQVLAARYS